MAVTAANLEKANNLKLQLWAGRLTPEDYRSQLIKLIPDANDQIAFALGGLKASDEAPAPSVTRKPPPAGSGKLPEIEPIQLDIKIPSAIIEGTAPKINWFGTDTSRYNSWADGLKTPIFKSYDEVINQINREDRPGEIFDIGWDYSVVPESARKEAGITLPNYVTPSNAKLKKMFVDSVGITSPDALYAWYVSGFGTKGINEVNAYDYMYNNSMQEQPKQAVQASIDAIKSNLGIDQRTLEVAIQIAANKRPELYNAPFNGNFGGFIADTYEIILKSQDKFNPQVRSELNKIRAQGEAEYQERVRLTKEAEKRGTGLEALVAIAGLGAAVFAPVFAPTIAGAIGLSGAAGNVIGGAILGSGISAAAGGDPLKGAIAGAVGSVGSTTYATKVGNALGVTSTTLAPVVGNAVINAGLSGIAAAATGANVEKSMLSGAVSGAASAGANQIAETILGKDNVASIAKTTGLSVKQVENIFSTSLANGLTAEIQGSGEFLQTVGSSLVSQGIGAKAANTMTKALDDSLKQSPGIKTAIITATGGIATVATNAAIQGQDVKSALKNSAPGIILSSVQAGQAESDRQAELAAQQRKDIVATQQPVQVAGPVAPALTDLDIALQLAEGRNETVVNLGKQDGIDSYLVTGKRDDGSTYTYTILSSPEIGVKYEYTTLPLDPISLRAIPGAAMGTSVSSEAPDFRIDPTIGVPSTQQLAKLDTAQDFEYLPSQLRFDLTQTIVRNELDRLERELQQSQASQQAFQRAQTQFTGLEERGLGQALSPEVRESLEDELARLEEEAQRATERAGQIESERATLTNIESGEQGLSDEQLLSFLETGEVPTGITGGQREGAGEAPEGGLEAGEGEGDGAGFGEGGEGVGQGAGGEGEGEGGTLTETRLRPSLIFDRATGGRPETTPFASRVTGQALEGILGEKEPLFGGDEDEQRAVWNRRSLRLLSRALGL